MATNGSRKMSPKALQVAVVDSIVFLWSTLRVKTDGLYVSKGREQYTINCWKSMDIYCGSETCVLFPSTNHHIVAMVVDWIIIEINMYVHCAFIFKHTSQGTMVHLRKRQYKCNSQLNKINRIPIADCNSNPVDLLSALYICVYAHTHSTS